MDRQIEEVAAVCELVRGRKKSAKRLWLSFDEWNVWYRATNGDGKRQEAPRLLEEVYDLRDALLVGGSVNTLLRHADRVRLACLAQLVNVIAPLVTSADGLLRQSTYHPYAWGLAHARGAVLDLRVETDGYEVKGLGSVPYLDVAGTFDAQKGESCLLVLNRDLVKARELEIVFREGAPARVVRTEVLTGDDLRAVNTFAEPRRVSPRPLEIPKPGPRMVVELPPRSYSVLVLAAS
jgi:alpha-N-arabinofuranosidase